MYLKSIWSMDRGYLIYTVTENHRKHTVHWTFLVVILFPFVKLGVWYCTVMFHNHSHRLMSIYTSSQITYLIQNNTNKGFSARWMYERMIQVICSSLTLWQTAFNLHRLANLFVRFSYQFDYQKDRTCDVSRWKSSTYAHNLNNALRLNQNVNLPLT